MWYSAKGRKPRMVFVAATLALATSFGSGVARANAAAAASADVLISAGHEGRPDCDRESASLCNNTGARGEIEWTPVVADEATAVLRAHGISVIRRPAYIAGPYHVADAIFIHFDGNDSPCASGASIGFPIVAGAANSRAAGQAWKALYRRFFKFTFQPDNFTDHLSGYYGFKHVDASDAKLVIEGGEISCPAQRAWLAPRLKFLGDLLASFLSERLGKGPIEPRSKP